MGNLTNDDVTRLQKSTEDEDGNVGCFDVVVNAEELRELTENWRYKAEEYRDGTHNSIQADRLDDCANELERVMVAAASTDGRE